MLRQAQHSLTLETAGQGFLEISSGACAFLRDNQFVTAN